MNTIELSGQQLPVLGMGSWHLGQNFHPLEQEQETLLRGLQVGLKVIDTAEMYGHGRSEKLIGDVLKQCPRESVFLVSKVLPWNANRLLIERSVKASLKRLGTHYLDLYLLHWRALCVLPEVVRCMNKLQQQGHIRAWGVSNFDVADMEALLAIPGGEQCVTNQVLYNPSARGIEFDLLPWSQAHTMPVMAYSPLGGQGEGLLNHPLFIQLGERLNVSASAVILAWCLRHRQVLAIPESGNQAHLLANQEALTLTLTEADLAGIDAVFPPPKAKQKLEMR